MPAPNLHYQTREYNRLRGRVTLWRCVALIGWTVAVLFGGAWAFGGDCLNADLQAASGDALRIAKHTGGTARLRYVTLYALPPSQRATAAAAVSVVCHQLSHAGVAVQPRRITETLLQLPLDSFDPHGVGWDRGWEEIVSHDTRYHYLDEHDANAQRFVGQACQVRCQDGIFRDGKVTRLDSGGEFYFQINGREFYSGKNVVKFAGGHTAGYGEWVDLAAAKLLEEITGSRGAILDARDFIYYTTRTPIYYSFRGTPKTLKEWLAKWGEVKSPSAFGEFNVRGANLNRSGVTYTVRGLERRKLPVWVTMDLSKAFDLTDATNPFYSPNRIQKFNATEALAVMPNGGLDCFIADGQGNRVDEVPAAVALDDSQGYPRELRSGASCWSCHTKVKGGEETSGFLAFTDDQSKRQAYTKDPLLAAQLTGYYGDQAKLIRDMQRDREDFYVGCLAATETGVGDGMTPSECFAAVETMLAQQTTDAVDPAQACRELCLDVEAEADPADVLSRWLNGTTNAALTGLMSGDSCHWQRFRLGMPEAFSRIHHRKQFGVGQ